MKKSLLDKMTVSEIERFIEGLNKLLNRRYNEGLQEGMVCPLCKVAHGIARRIHDNNDYMCYYCIWWAMMKLPEENDDASPCERYIYTRFCDPNEDYTNENFDMFASAIVRKWRRESIPIWINRLNKYLKERTDDK